MDLVFECRTLPSLPAVALKVLELTRDPKLQLDRIATIVQNDPALTSKILRTVNSSYYGLAKPCPTISRAVTLLGFNAVKSLVLGFSLVEMTRNRNNSAMDLLAYWRRAVYSAAGARLLAKRMRVCDPEEAFVAALLQDVGTLAMLAALGEQYSTVLRSAGEDHDGLSVLESRHLGIDHAEVGAELTIRWKLPPQITECTRMHHAPDQADPQNRPLVRLVAVGGDAAAALSLNNPSDKLERFYQRLWDWFEVERDESKQLLSEIADGASHISSLLEIRTGPKANIAAILAEANERLSTHQIAVQQEAITLQKTNSELTRQAATDPLTGVGNRRKFQAELERLLTGAIDARKPLSLLFIDVDRFKQLNDTFGHPVGDTVLAEIAVRVRDNVPQPAVVCRYGGEEFAIVLPKTDCARAQEIAERIRESIATTPAATIESTAGRREVRTSVSIGVASTSGLIPTQAGELVQAADNAVYHAKHDGRNCVRVAPACVLTPQSAPILLSDGAAPSPGAPPSRQFTVLLVEDDALAARLIEAMFARKGDAKVVVCATAEEGLRLLTGTPQGLRPDAILTDTGLPGMNGVDFVRALRRDARHQATPIVAMAISADENEKREALAAGANAFITKSQISANINEWVNQVVDLASARRKAA